MGLRYFTYRIERISVTQFPMTKEQLGQFNGRSIRFSLGGLTFQGAIHYDSWRDAFRIIYPVIEDGRSRNEDLPLNGALIERISFSPKDNLLVLD